MALVVFAALLFWACVFGIYFGSQKLSLAEFLFGRYEPLPDGLGDWKEVERDATSIREERFVVPESGAHRGRLLHQVRYRDCMTREVVRVEPEAVVRRRRVRTSSPN